MSVCLALLQGPLDHKQMQYWSNTEIFQDHILHVETLTGVNPVGGQLTADAFVIPPSIDVKQVEGLALFDCETSLVSSQYGFQCPALGIQCLKDDNILCLQGWCDEQSEPETYESNCVVLDDPCALYKELRCCYFKLVKEQQKVSVAFRDRRVQFAPKTDSDISRLYTMMKEAEAECDACNGKQNMWRGGYLGHSCIRPPCKGGCGCG